MLRRIFEVTLAGNGEGGGGEGRLKVKLHLMLESIVLQLVKLKHYVSNFKIITLSSYYSTTIYLK